MPPKANPASAVSPAAWASTRWLEEVNRDRSGARPGRDPHHGRPREHHPQEPSRHGPPDRPPENQPHQPPAARAQRVPNGHLGLTANGVRQDETGGAGTRRQPRQRRDRKQHRLKIRHRPRAPLRQGDRLGRSSPVGAGIFARQPSGDRVDLLFGLRDGASRLQPGDDGQRGQTAILPSQGTEPLHGATAPRDEGQDQCLIVVAAVEQRRSRAQRTHHVVVHGAHDGERLPIHIDDTPDSPGIRPELRAPEARGHQRHSRRPGLKVRLVEQAADARHWRQRLEEVRGHVDPLDRSLSRARVPDRPVGACHASDGGEDLLLRGQILEIRPRELRHLDLSQAEIGTRPDSPARRGRRGPHTGTTRGWPGAEH